ncbi:hypothetical protein [Methylosinus sp. PW1]|uniref:hypothetical protein n=1 Tax=Methylosinus sp. PW1 TaxID=107636 RepID=UPI00055C464E|nr:hypothetical protein [Methylosinus sp. PW1]
MAKRKQPKQSDAPTVIDFEVYGRAARIFEVECRAKGALLPWGFGFLSDELQEPYLARARAEMMAEQVEG